MSFRPGRARTRHGAIAAALLAALVAAPAQAQVPPNDECSGAEPIACGDSVIASTLLANPDIAPTCTTVDGNQGGLWYSITGTGQEITATTCGATTDFNTRMRVYEGTCAGLVCVAGNDNDNTCSSSQTFSTVTWISSPGIEYLLLVHGKANDAGTFELSVSCPPPNDDCANASSISVGATAFSTVEATTDGLTLDPAACDPGPNGDDQVHNDVWYTYTAAATGALTVTTCEELGGSADFDTRVAVYSSTACPADPATCIGSNDDDPTNPCGTVAGGLKSTVTVPVDTGQSYLVRLGGFGSGDSGSGTLSLSLAAADVTVDIALAGVTGDVTRCISFELIDCDGVLPPLQVDQEVAFVAGAAAGLTLPVECGGYDCISARDPLHTLRRTVDIVSASGGCSADFTATSPQGDRSLIGGNLNGDVYIDILDFGAFVNQFDAAYGSPDTNCAMGPFHADLSADPGGVVDLADFTFIQINYFLQDDPDCCPPPLLARPETGSAGPRAWIDVRELGPLRLRQLEVADLNRDGRLDGRDMAAFLNGRRPESPGR